MNFTHFVKIEHDYFSPNTVKILIKWCLQHRCALILPDNAKWNIALPNYRGNLEADYDPNLGSLHFVQTRACANATKPEDSLGVEPSLFWLYVQNRNPNGETTATEADEMDVDEVALVRGQAAGAMESEVDSTISADREQQNAALADDKNGAHDDNKKSSLEDPASVLSQLEHDLLHVTMDLGTTSMPAAESSYVIPGPRKSLHVLHLCGIDGVYDCLPRNTAQREEVLSTFAAIFAKQKRDEEQEHVDRLCSGWPDELKA